MQESLTNVYRDRHTRAARVRIAPIDEWDRGRESPALHAVSDPNARFGVGIRECAKEFDSLVDMQSSRGGTVVTAVLRNEQVSDNPESATRKRA